MKKNLAITLMLAATLSLSACASKTSTDTQKNTETTVAQTSKETQESKEAQEETKKVQTADTLVYGITSSPEGKFNQLISNTQYDGNVNSLIYDSLLKLNSKIEIEPSMAKEYELLDEGKKIIFKLKDNLKFHDGTKLTSKDVRFTLEALANKDYQGDLQSYVQSIEGFKEFNEGKESSLKGIKTPDEQTIEIEFSVPYSPVLINLGTLAILPEHIWSKIEVKDWDKENDALKHPIGSGPYKFEEFKLGEYVKLSANSDYHKSEPKIKNFIFKVVNEETVSAELIQASVDICDISSLKNSDVKLLQEQNVIVNKYPNSKIQYMGFNLRDERLKDNNLRQAFAYAIDREAILNGLLEGNGLIINTPMVPTFWSYPKEGLIEYKFDLEKSKELLEKAGYVDTDNNGYVDKDGKDLVLTLTAPTGDKIREKTATVIQENMKQAGVKIELEMMEFKAMMQKVVGNHEFELYLMGNTLDADPDPTPNWYSTQSSDEKGVFGWNIAAFKSEVADKLMDENRKATDLEERTKILNEFGKVLNQELPWLPLYASDIVKAYNKGLKNYAPNTFVDFYNVENWELEK